MRDPGGRAYVIGVGLHRFGVFPDRTVQDLAAVAVDAALADARVSYGDVGLALYAHVYSEGTTPGQALLARFGLTGVPVLNVENACASGSSALWQAYLMIGAGLVDLALVVGADKVPSGPVTVTSGESPDRFLGTDHMMAEYALRARSYMHEHGAPAEAIAQVAVKARAAGEHNPYAHVQQAVTLEDVLSSRMVSDPLTLFQCCRTSTGAAAAVVASEVAVRRLGAGGRAVRIHGASLRTTPYREAGSHDPEGTELAARDAYEAAGLGPEDVDLVQVHDAATIGELEHLEYAGLFEPGTAWIATREGRTAPGGDLPVNTDGGLQSMGHPFGATGIRMAHELVTQIRGEGGGRQIAKAGVGLAQCTGSGGVNTVMVLGRP
jgi:acetyl-CoA acetyltransferase